MAARALKSGRKVGRRPLSNHTIEEQVSAGKEGFATMRDQYIYSTVVTHTRALGLIWGCSSSNVEQLARKHRWRELRAYHLAQVARQVTEIAKREAEEEAEGAITHFRSVLGLFQYHVTTHFQVAAAVQKKAEKESRLPRHDELISPRDLRSLFLVQDGVAKAWDRLNGLTAVEQVAQRTREEHEWVRGWMMENVTDPALLKRFAEDMREHRIQLERREVSELLEVARAPAQGSDAVRRARDELDRMARERGDLVDVEVREVVPGASEKPLEAGKPTEHPSEPERSKGAPGRKPRRPVER